MQAGNSLEFSIVHLCKLVNCSVKAGVRRRAIPACRARHLKASCELPWRCGKFIASAHAGCFEGVGVAFEQLRDTLFPLERLPGVIMAKSIVGTVLGAFLGAIFAGAITATVSIGDSFAVVYLRHALCVVFGAGFGAVAGAIVGGTNAILDAMSRGNPNT
jgi:hypothetical protein